MCYRVAGVIEFITYGDWMIATLAVPSQILLVKRKVGYRACCDVVHAGYGDREIMIYTCLLKKKNSLHH